MKVLHINAAYKPAYIYGGPTMSVAMLCEELVKASVHVAAFTTTANCDTELPVTTNSLVNIDGVAVTYFKRITKDHTHFSPALLKALWVNARKYDIIHIHAWWNLVSVFSCLVAVLKKVPVVVSPRGTLSPYSFINKNAGIKKLIHRLLSAPLLSRSHIHATSVNESSALSRIIKSKSISVIPNFVRLAPADTYDADHSSEPLRLLFFSRIEKKKGLDILIEALSLITVPVLLTIAGDGNSIYIDQLKTLAHTKGIASKITWLKGVYGDDKFNLLSQYHLLVLPSHNENFGNVVIESLSTGTAVLISEQVGLASYVIDNNMGWVCKTEASSVAESINDIAMHQRDQLALIRKKAPAILSLKFTGQELANEYINLYKQIAGHD